jgi:hypothetical protein
MVAKSITTGGKVCIILGQVLLSRKGEGGALPECLLFQGRA